MARPDPSASPRLTAILGGRSRAQEPRSDAELLAAVAKGDARVASELFERLAPTVSRTLYRVFGRRETDHDDLVQVTFEQIVLSLRRERYAGACSLERWAASVASHVGLNALRGKIRERKVFDRSAVDPPPPSADLDRELHARFELLRVRRALACLSAEKANTVFLHDVLGHSLPEIATLTGASVAAAQTRLVRGRRELCAELTRDGAES